MFVGSVNAQMRRVLNDMRYDIKGRDVCVGCSGNFTIDRIFSELSKVHSNDVSLYSYCIGDYLIGGSVDYEIVDDDFNWMGEYMSTPLDRVVLMVLAHDFLQYYGKDNPYYDRMCDVYLSEWAVNFNKTKEKISPILDSINIESYYSGDVIEFYEQTEGIAVAFPPTYMGGYEKMYKNLESVFDLDAPSYDLVTVDEMFWGIHEVVKDRDIWMIFSDKERDLPVVAKVRPDTKYKEVYLYGKVGDMYYLEAKDKYELCGYLVIEEEEITELKLIPLTMGQFRYLRSKFLAKKIVGGDFILTALALTNQDDKLIGFMAFSNTSGEVYMTLDASVQRAQSRYKRLSKLVILASLTKEIQNRLRNITGMLVDRIRTTVFTDAPVSSKYRGVFELERRDEGKLIYSSKAGVLNLAEALDLWKEKYERIS